ncbi:MAG: RNase adapter RapZ [Deltaproteobacteria bacterium]|nr:RNase adapter RapZ [Deltaproteobacteria bacterium]MDP7297827.1 RNase adapter RapZ [Myxococcota bacterium]HJO23390.1 RNase adapter RapZ [Myxococcota bacterium]
MTAGTPQVVFVGGLSGSGKTTAMAALEDLSFYCVDNLPAQLIEQFLHLCEQSTPPIEKIALAVETRALQFLAEVPAVVERLRSGGVDVQVVFLECTNAVLEERYRETRRVHPQAADGTVGDGIERERALLAQLAGLADHLVDTSSLNVHELKADVIRRIAGAARETLVNLVSFGFRYSTPQTAELLFDVRFLPNPYFEDGLRQLTGRDQRVADHALDNERGRELMGHLSRLLEFLLPLYDQEGKAYLTIGVGCTGGRHRSVAVVEALADVIRAGAREVNVQHRDVERSQ